MTLTRRVTSTGVGSSIAAPAALAALAAELAKPAVADGLTRIEANVVGHVLGTRCHPSLRVGPSAWWRMGWDSNPRDACTPGGFQDRCLKPLGHPSGACH